MACVRAARRRHQQSPEGRLDHRDHQRAYRARRRVMDQGSLRPHRFGRLAAVAPVWVRRVSWHHCIVCGRSREELGVTPVKMSSAEFGDFVVKQAHDWQPAIKAADLKP